MAKSKNRNISFECEFCANLVSVSNEDLDHSGMIGIHYHPNRQETIFYVMCPICDKDNTIF